MQFSDPEDKFKVVEVEVFEEDNYNDDKKYNAEAPVVLPRTQNAESENTASRRKTREVPREKKQTKNKYGWAFFLSSLFLGVGITATTELPMGIFAGLSIGFLFFVDPIYDRVMDMIEKR
ncbi:MAG: hypothetical protein SF052_16395 [Bacteroidia bacterium]|nr:hypothetical protein [Bacteroidia bacterium]